MTIMELKYQKSEVSENLKITCSLISKVIGKNAGISLNSLKNRQYNTENILSLREITSLSSSNIKHRI